MHRDWSVKKSYKWLNKDITFFAVTVLILMRTMLISARENPTKLRGELWFVILSPESSDVRYTIRPSRYLDISQSAMFPRSLLWTNLKRRRASLYIAEALILVRQALNTVNSLVLDAAMRVLSFWLKGSSCARQSRETASTGVTASRKSTALSSSFFG